MPGRNNRCATVPHRRQLAASASSKKTVAKTEFALNERFDCLWKSDYYKVKIVNVEKKDDGEAVYTIHYQGWNKGHDEKISHSDAVKRFKAPNAETAHSRKRNADGELLNENGHGFEADEPIDEPEHQQTEEAFPANLFQILEKDHELVSRKYLPKVPGDHSVDDVFTAYHKSVLTRMSEADAYQTLLHLDKLTALFNKTINKGVLYKFECLQYRDRLVLKRQEFNRSEPSLKDVLAQHKSFTGPQTFVPEEGNVNPVNIQTLDNFIDTYGPIHLIRFLWSALKQKDHPDHSLHVEVLDFISLHAGKYFNARKDYKRAPSAYKRTMSSI